VLKEAFGLHAVGVSIDDFYKTYAARHAMAESIHPLFATRSVAGTHDTTLAINTLKTLRSLSSGACSIPRFDKSLFNGEGDRVQESKWTTTLAPVDVVLFEGWFVAAEPQTDDELKHAINDREREEDSDGVWRQTLNHHLATDYAELFDLLDELIVIQVGGMESIYRNRELQEQKLREATKDNAGGSGAMSPEAVIRFIALYERTTRHMLKTLPNRARIVMNLGESHRIESVRVNPPSDELRGFN
jgi:D-glycerate 3-kinase